MNFFFLSRLHVICDKFINYAAMVTKDGHKTRTFIDAVKLNDAREYYAQLIESYNSVSLHSPFPASIMIYDYSFWYLVMFVSYMIPSGTRLLSSGILKF